MEQLILQKFFKVFNETWPSGKALRLGRRNRLFESDRLEICYSRYLHVVQIV